MSESRKSRTPDQLLDDACAWIERSGWPTQAADFALADEAYQRWLIATDAEFAQHHNRDFELLGDLIRSALSSTHDDESLDNLQAVLLLFLAQRGRQEGMLEQEHIH